MSEEFIAASPHDDDWDDSVYEDEGDDVCDGCGRGEMDDGQCPLCCGNMFAPGSEECDFCEYSEECAEHAASL